MIRVLLTEMDMLTIRLGLAVLENIPIRFVKKRQISEKEFHIIDAIYEKVDKECLTSEKLFSSDEIDLIKESLTLCFEEERASLDQNGKSAHLDSDFALGSERITLEHFVSLLQKINEAVPRPAVHKQKDQ